MKYLTLQKAKFWSLLMTLVLAPQLALAQQGKNALEGILRSGSNIITFGFWVAFFIVTWEWINKMMSGGESFKGLIWPVIWAGLALNWQDVLRVFGLNV